MEKPHLLALLIGVTVNPGKERGAAARDTIWYIYCFIQAELPQPPKAKVAHGVAKWVEKGGTSGRARENTYLSFYTHTHTHLICE